VAHGGIVFVGVRGRFEPIERDVVEIGDKFFCRGHGLVLVVGDQQQLDPVAGGIEIVSSICGMQRSSASGRRRLVPEKAMHFSKLHGAVYG
jgi:hypothetical protein